MNNTVCNAQSLNFFISAQQSFVGSIAMMILNVKTMKFVWIKNVRRDVRMTIIVRMDQNVSKMSAEKYVKLMVFVGIFNIVILITKYASIDVMDITQSRHVKKDTNVLSPQNLHRCLTNSSILDNASVLALILVNV